MSTKRIYSAEEKRCIVETYLQCKISQQELAERYGTGKATIGNWLRLYQTFCKFRAPSHTCTAIQPHRADKIATVCRNTLPTYRKEGPVKPLPKS